MLAWPEVERHALQSRSARYNRRLPFKTTGIVDIAILRSAVNFTCASRGALG